MAFTSPIFLLALAPWLLASLWLLLGQRRSQEVPFLELWQGPEAVPKTHRHIRRPPLWLALAIAAMLLGVLGAAGPQATSQSISPSRTISVVLDRGQTMSADESPSGAVGRLR